jgi:hypothetical protein
MPAAAHPRAPDAAPPPPARVVVLGQAALLVAAWAFIFSPIWRGGWLWDDDTEVTSNLQLRTWAGLRDIWLAPTGADYFPLKSTVQWLLWQGWGNDPAGYHLASASLHLLAAFLFWRVLEKLGVRLAWLGGLLFVIHPLVIESVAWVSELKNTLSLPLVLLAYLAYLDYDARGRRGDYRRALLWFVAAMLCKTSVVMLPVVLLLFTWWKYGRLTRAGVRDSLPFFAVALILGLVTVWFQQERAIGEATLTLTSGDLPTRVARAGLAVWFYLEKCVLPVGLLPVYPPWRLEGLRAWLAWPAVAALLAWLWTQRAGWGRHALLGYGFFLLNLAPVLGLIPMSYLTIAPVADHFVYLSVLGILGLAAAGAGEIWRRLERGGRVFAATGAVVVALLLAGESRQYTAVFHD